MSSHILSREKVALSVAIDDRAETMTRSLFELYNETQAGIRFYSPLLDDQVCGLS